MKINSSIKQYDIILENNRNFVTELSQVKNAQYVIDLNIYELYESEFKYIPKERLMLIEAIEQNKVIDTALSICEKITVIPAKRNATLISFGGGIIQDITGFVANIMYRGINWIFVPTTLLAACDSCIGGKTSLNYKKYKNLLGTFYPPDKIHICSEFFQTLTEKDYKSGLGEVIKFNIMRGISGLENIENNIEKLVNRDVKTIDRFVKSSLQFKKRFIEVDEFDRGERIKLNFAHTFGHAIETVTDYKISHGTAVAIGMIMADSISVKRHLMEQDIMKRCENVLLEVVNIEKKLLQVPLENYLTAMRKDKKQTSENLTAVLITEYGDTATLNVVHDIQIEEVKYAINYFLEIYEEHCR